MSDDDRAFRIRLPSRRANSLIAAYLLSCLVAAPMLLTVGLLLGEGAGPITWGVLVTLATVLMSWWCVPYALGLTVVTVGRDGLQIKGRGVASFLPFRDLAEALEVGEREIRLIKRNGDCVDLYTGKQDAVGQKRRYVDRCDELLRRIQNGIARVRDERPEEGDAGEALLERAHVLLRSAPHETATAYRTIAAPNEAELWETLERDGTSPTERAAAAALLRAQGDEAAERLRFVMQHTANPPLRTFLRVASTDATAEQLGQALVEFEAAQEEAVAGERAVDSGR